MVVPNPGISPWLHPFPVQLCLALNLEDMEDVIFGILGKALNVIFSFPNHLTALRLVSGVQCSFLFLTPMVGVAGNLSFSNPAFAKHGSFSWGKIFFLAGSVFFVGVLCLKASLLHFVALLLIVSLLFGIWTGGHFAPNPLVL